MVKTATFLDQGTAMKHPPKTSHNGESFGQRMARLRNAAGYSQREFAEELGISQRMVAYYEAQSQYPPAHLLPIVAKALGVSADQILGLEPVPKRQPLVNQQLLRRLKKIEQLPAHKQRVLLTTIDTFLDGVEHRKASG
jgi:transcriptional regulator with XRE-family HTH domain